MPKLSPSEIADKFVRKTSAAGQDYRRGVSAPRRDPIQAAIKANAKRIQKLQESITKKTWEEAMGKLSLADWQTPASTVGADHYVSGAGAAKSKVERFWSSYAPLLDAHMAKIDAMPQDTPEQREQRMIANKRGLEALKGKWR